MKLFETSVAIGCDLTPDMIKDAYAIRAVLEAFGLRAHLYPLTRRRDALIFLAGDIAPCEYVVLCCHGGEIAGTIDLQVIDQEDDNYDNPRGWDIITFTLTPANIPEHVVGMGRTLVCGACSAGKEALARAFCSAGYKAYIASDKAVFGPAGVLFVIGFFYHLVSATDLDREPTNVSDSEAAVLAAAIDAEFPRGTLPFQYFSPRVEPRISLDATECE